MTVLFNRINNKYSSQTSSSRLPRQNWKEYDQKSHAFLCCSVQVKAFSFRQLKDDHLFSRNCAKVSKYLFQSRRRDSGHKK